MKRLILLLFLVISPLLAQRPGEQVYSLEQATEIAVQRNLTLDASAARIRAANAGITNAFGEYLPGISFELGYRRTLSFPTVMYFNGQVIPLPSSSLENAEKDNYSMSVMANYTLFDGFRREARYSQSEETLDASYLQHQHAINQIKREVYNGYVNVIRNQQIVKIRQENLALGRKELERIQAQYQAGVIPVNQVYAQEAQLGNDEISLVQAENDRDVAKAQLLGFMGLNPDQDVEFLESSLPTNLTLDQIENFSSRLNSLNAMINQALKNREDYKAAQHSLRAAEDAVRMANASYFPQLYATGGWMWSHSQFSNIADFDNSFLALSLQVPIFENFRTNYQVQNAKAQVEESESQYLQLEQNIRSTLKSLHLQLETAERQLQITQKSLMSAEKNYQAAQEMFRLGRTAITDYILANTQYVTAQINRITAIYNYLLVRNDILFQTGELD